MAGGLGHVGRPGGRSYDARVTASVHQEIAQQLADVPSVMLIGAIDTGKTTMARRLVRTAMDAGRTVGYVDADIGNSSIGPPSCVSLKVVRNDQDLEQLDHPDALHFVGGISAERLILQQVIATAALVEQARQSADTVVINTTGVISGVGEERR